MYCSGFTPRSHLTGGAKLLQRICHPSPPTLTIRKVFMVCTEERYWCSHPTHWIYSEEMKLKVTTSECVSLNGLYAGVFFWPENRRKTVETRQSMDWRLECFVCHRNQRRDNRKYICVCGLPEVWLLAKGNNFRLSITRLKTTIFTTPYKKACRLQITYVATSDNIFKRVP